MDPKSKLAQTELTIEVVEDILLQNCQPGVYETLMTKTPLGGVKDKISVQAFFNIVDRYKFHWTDKTPRIIKDFTRKMLKNAKLPNDT